MNKIDLFNAKNSSTPIQKGQVINVIDTGSFPDKDKDGHDVTVSALKDVDGTIYCSISATVNNSLDMLNEIIEEANGQPVKVQVIEGTSNNGRNFYQLKIIG